jgi:hypothetical protein
LIDWSVGGGRGGKKQEREKSAIGTCLLVVLYLFKHTFIFQEKRHGKKLQAEENIGTSNNNDHKEISGQD